MSLPTFRYALDPTGTNRNNLVANEIKALADTPTRVCVPEYGAFFGESFKIWDNVTQRPLDRNVDYSLVELLADPSAHYGKEIYSVVLILNRTVSSSVRYTYQVLGGYYQNDSTAIAALYETVINDNRPINFSAIRNKPYAFNPSEHSHLLEDIYGFDAVVSALERLGQAYVLGDVPAFEALVDWMNSKFTAYKEHLENKNNPHETTAAGVGLGLVENLPVLTELEAAFLEPVHKYVTADRLYTILNTQYATMQVKKTQMSEGTQLNVSVLARNIADGDNLYWTIEHIGTSDSDFSSIYGYVTMVGENAKFSVYAYHDEDFENIESFRILLRTQSVTGPVISRTENITLLNVLTDEENTFNELVVAGDVSVPGVCLSGRSHFILANLQQQFSEIG